MVSKSIFSSAFFLPVLFLHILTTTKESSAICRSDEHQPQNFKCDWWEDLEQIRRKELVEELIIRNEMPFMCTSAAFVRFPRIKYLRLPSGLFMSVGRDCFNGLKQIAEIDLKNNDLNEFHFNSLNDSTLAFLTLTGNLLRSLTFEQMVLPRLRHLILSKNLLETLYVDRYNFPNIIDISADNNHIHTFFIASDALYTLRLSENDIVGFAADSLKSRSLEYLHLQNNRIRRISLDSFKNLPKIKQIFLDGNPLEVLECNFSNVTEFSLHENMIIIKREDHASFSVHLDWWKVQQLVFSSNKIRSYNLLRRLENSVQELNLDHNELSQIGEGDLATFTNLFVLDMSHNRISSIHYEAFDRLSKLHTLNLAHNCIQHLSGVLFNSLRSITSITLTTNLLTYFPIPGWDNQTNLITQTEYHVSGWVIFCVSVMFHPNFV